MVAQIYMRQYLGGAEVLGVAPHQLRIFRAQTAAATGMVQAQRCATMALGIDYGVDPAIEVLKRSWLLFSCTNLGRLLQWLLPLVVVELLDVLPKKVLLVWGYSMAMRQQISGCADRAVV